MTEAHAPDLASSGIPGLDRILHGGLPRDGLHLLLGGPGTGKTTLGLQFLLNGVKQGERSLYLSLAESEKEVGRIATSHAWRLRRSSRELRSLVITKDAVRLSETASPGSRARRLRRLAGRANGRLCRP